ncbi:MAG: flagellar basal-body MS-ring/collar protein FliF [Methylococcales bacterium]|nr:flagellar basal-body MS-ring/collar protein FliF [Methylobacter sp.]MDP2426572.1 flagellar basal-body MS-ring/collar protein FliF [Methylobacter sp.]MDP3056737.1 flagellar basal-body MS-ring/collar protein FliF [Methylobacter sp.]MDP3360931.1 flagellar basal-body MS-ring/collar protein FliF [Methylobacter sp.]MDZ4157911.1 flagellar basal-body MS-ring/collar protein FliF [Methylococcales bacterium]
MSEQANTNLVETNRQHEPVANNNGPIEGNASHILASTAEAHPAIQGLAGLTIARQMGLMLGLALSVAIGVAIVLWSQEPSYGRLYSEIGESDVAEIIEVLNKENIKYKVESGSGAIMVPMDEVSAVKLKLAAQGLPKSNSLGYEILDKDPGFGTSKSVELMRFQRALEGEIARTIMAIQNVKAARVLLAIPVQSVFVRERKKPSASVMLNLYQGRSLDKGQVESIIHLVASSVPQLEAEQVTVVDQKGQLLNSKDSSIAGNLTVKQFEYKKNIEEHLMGRIENILSPLVGGAGMRVQVSADVDFTETDRTQEMFNPDLPALRSEQTSEEQNSLSAIQGVPGALTNQPTPAGVAPEPPPGAAEGAAGTPTSLAKNATRNYELDKTITHTRLATGGLRRLSVAVVVDDRRIVQDDGAIKVQSYSQEDVNRFTDLIKQAVGFDSSRGDQVTVTNATFRIDDAIEALPELPVWEQGWFLDIMKQAVAVLAVLFLLFGVLRPTMRGLVARDLEEKKALALAEAEAKAAAMGGMVRFDERGMPIAVPANQPSIDFSAAAGDIDDLLLLDVPQSYEHRLEYVKRLVDDDSKIVAQVIKSWIKKDG